MTENEFSTAYSTAFDATGPDGCSWPVSYADCSGECDAYEKFPDPADAQAMFEAIAADFLAEWTGGVFGLCPTVLRPCRAGCEGSGGGSTYWGRGPNFDPGFPRAGTGGYSTGVWTPVMLGGKWYNMSCGCAGACTCSVEGAGAITLPGPVASVQQVKVDGVVLPASAYRVMYKRVLVRADGGVWPACQDLLAESSEVGTFEVTYTRGVPVPIGGQVAAGRLACELALAACGSEDCALPERVQTVTRQGITVGILDEFADVEKGKTGIWSIDSWLASVTQVRPVSYIRSVDVPKAPPRGGRGY